MSSPNCFAELNGRNVYKLAITYIPERLEQAKEVYSASSAQKARNWTRTQNL